MGVKNEEQQLEALETLSLTDFPITEDAGSSFQDQQPQSSSTEDFFEFFNGGLGQSSEERVMSHAEDMIAGGKLIPINDKPHHKPPQSHRKNESHEHKEVCRRRSESMHELKRNTTNSTASRLVRSSQSFDYRKLNQNSRITSEPANRSSFSSSARWSDLVFGPVKMPEMDLQNIRSRQIVKNSSKSGDGFPVNRRFDHRKTSWGVLGILSCKSSGSVAVTMPSS